MKNLKKILLVLTMAVLVVTTVSCGSKNEESSPTQEPQITQTASPSPTASQDGAKEEKSTPTPEQTKKETPTPTPQKKEEKSTPTPTVKTNNTPVATPQQAQSTPTPTPQKKTITAADASAYIGKSASSLAAAIGQPNSKSYASSCIGEGEDGEWYYDGFTVYTYRDTNGSERVEDVF